MRAPRVQKHEPSPLPWKLKTRRTMYSKTLICWIVDANGDLVVDEFKDEDGSVYADYKLIVEKVNG